MTVQGLADAVSIALAKLGARVKVQDSHFGSVYLKASLPKGGTTTIRVSDHPSGKRWKGGFDLWPFFHSDGDPDAIAKAFAPEAIRALKKNG